MRRITALVLGFGILAGVIVLLLMALAGDSELFAQEAGGFDRSETADCFLAAKANTTLLDNQAAVLCRGTPTPTGPVACYLAADNQLTLTMGQKIDLCRCAESAAPVDCFSRIKDQSFLLDAQISNLCAPVEVSQLLSNCRPATY